ncbi:MAG TPA: hypothetical protein DEP28_00190 [Bacteroidetes bacterium]|nr:hypothetical protein [Bacteroidota bacterium]HCN38169.1 hypothetical protein [Bacteroidota bacterium]
MNLVKIKTNDDLLKTINETFDSLLFPFSNVSGKSNIAPRAEITEDKDNFYLNLEIPGVNKDDVKVSIENNVLTIKGVKKETYNKEEKNLIMNERYYGEFTRSFNLTKDINVNSIDAQFNNGVLHITLPKVEEAKPVVKEINIK